MTMPRIREVEVVRYPVLRVTFDDGLSGEYDLSEMIEGGPFLKPLKDEDYFRTVKVAAFGHSYGWNLDEEGHEIDLCPDATRIRIETDIVEARAASYAARLTAAE